MPARRRVTGHSESDDNFTVVIDSPISYNQEEKVKYPAQSSWTGHLQFGQQIFQSISTKVQQVTQIPQNLDFSSVLPNTSSPQAVQSPSPTRDSIFDQEEETQIEFIMTARDRTAEFGNAIRSLQSRNIQRAVNIRDPKRVKQMQSYAEFMMIAKTVGKNIASTYAKLEKLTLCK